MTVTRTVTITFDSHVNDDLWNAMYDELVETAEQIACDYAAAATNDNYRVDINDTTARPCRYCADELTDDRGVLVDSTGGDVCGWNGGNEPHDISTDIIEYPDGPNQLTSGNVRVAWTELGEGYSGEYDPTDPDDVELLRFDVLSRSVEVGEWEFVEEGSFCTEVPVTATPEQRAALLRVLMDEFEPFVVSGRSVKGVSERMSRLSLAAI